MSAAAARWSSREALPDAQLTELEALVERALATGDDTSLRVLGYGEITLVLGWPAAEPAVACKRLPVFPSRERLDAYSAALLDYVAALRAAGVDAIETDVRSIERADGLAAYVVQPAFPTSSLVTTVLGGADPAGGHPIVSAVVDTAAGAVSPRIGLDAQVTNWLWIDGRLRYLDVTTPLIWGVDGACRLDLRLLVRSMPWAFRGTIRRFVAPGIIAKYRDRRGVLLDVCANLIKDGLASWMPAFIAAANARVDKPITREAAERYYRSDARTWELLLRIRRLDRAWQRRIRRRPYPFLLPKAIRR